MSVIFNQKSLKHPKGQTPFTASPVVTVIMVSWLWVVKHQSSITSGPITLNDIRKSNSVSISCTISPELKRRAHTEPMMLKRLTGTFLVIMVNHVSLGHDLENHVVSFVASQYIQSSMTTSLSVFINSTIYQDNLRIFTSLSVGNNNIRLRTLSVNLSHPLGFLLK